MEQYAINPRFDSKLVSTVVELERLRDNPGSGDTPLWLFRDLRDTLSLLESLASTRIEGNHTTLIEAVNSATGVDLSPDEGEQEILNVQDALTYINASFSVGDNITLGFIRELQSRAVRRLRRDGSRTPGKFRTGDVKIANSQCVVTPPALIESDMLELTDYINAPHEPQENIIRIACAHHRMTAIHPFDNGNGRTARLLTYTMLIKYGYLTDEQTILNPSAIFCMDRQKYYDMLAAADTGTPRGVEIWCEYVASGILGEMQKMRRLLSRDFAVDKLIKPAIRRAYQAGELSDLETQILTLAADRDTIQAGNVGYLFGTSSSERVRLSRYLKHMVEKGLLAHPGGAPKKYVMRFYNRVLLKYVLDEMKSTGLVLVDDE